MLSYSQILLNAKMCEKIFDGDFFLNFASRKLCRLNEPSTDQFKKKNQVNTLISILIQNAF